MSTTIEYFGSKEYTRPEAVSRVSPSVVRITYYEGVYNRTANGTIFSCKPDRADNAQFVSYILTTTNLFNVTGYEHNKKPDPLVYKIHVCLPTGQSYEGVVMAHDVEINAVVIKIKSDHRLPVAMLTPFTDWISVIPFGVSESQAAFCLSPYPTKISPGDHLTVVCTSSRFHALAFSAIYSVDFIGNCSDSNPFLRVICKRINDGAPVINCEGDVIGVAFNFRSSYVAFLPINIFFKWWKHVLTYGEICRPWMGTSITNLYAVDINDLEAVVHDCDVYDGVLIEKVTPESPAHSAGIRPNDVICQCDGRPVRSLLEFLELLWDKSGEVIEAKGVRKGRHFTWKVEIKAIKAGMLPEAGVLPEWLVAKSLAEKVVAEKKSTKKRKNKAKDRKKDKEGTGLMARTRKKGR